MQIETLLVVAFLVIWIAAVLFSMEDYRYIKSSKEKYIKLNPKVYRTPYTTVTAFYLSNKAKHSPVEYERWISNFWTLKKNCILFTDSKTKKWLETFVSLKNVKVNIMEKKHFITAKYDWNAQHELDTFKRYHSAHIYSVWNEKINFIKLAVKQNPYKTQWFIWNDIGSMREPFFNGCDFRSSPVLSTLDINYPHFFCIHNTTVNNFYNQPNLIEPDPKQIDRTDKGSIQATFILTSIDSIDQLHQDYYSHIDMLYKKNIFIGKEELNYKSLYKSKKTSMKLIEIHGHKYLPEFSDVWFFPYPFLQGDADYLIVNNDN